jgi:hypothetical protein
MITIPDSYNESRARFQARLSTLQNLWPDARLTSLPLPGWPHLSTDILTTEPLAAKDRLIVLSTGEHGIEGYLGSAVLELFFEEYALHLNPQSTGLLLIHAINPWGMENRERNNSDNVDLNRNFVTTGFSALADFNIDYPALSPYLNPRGPLRHLASARLSFIASTAKNFIVFGSRRMREAALMGQYRFQGGIYFGGMEIQPETEAMMKVYREAFAGYREIIHLDMHTGYGPRKQMTLVTSPLEKMPAAKLKDRFDVDLVAAANPDEFYTIQGDMIDWEYGLVRKEFPAVKFFAATCEFGTYGDSIFQAARSLQITILKNQLKQNGGSREASRWVEREYHELYLPSDPAWLEKALNDSRCTFNAVMKML